MVSPPNVQFFFFNDTATTEIYTLSLHDALPISWRFGCRLCVCNCDGLSGERLHCGLYKLSKFPHDSRLLPTSFKDRKSTRLNSSHSQISYAVFCLKKKNTTSSPVRAARQLSCPS